MGAKVLKIGKYDTDRAFAEVEKMIGHENEQGARYWAQHLLAMPEVLHGLGITRTADEVPLTLDGGRGEERITLHAFAPVEIMAGDTATLFNRRKDWVDMRDLGGAPDPLWLSRTSEAFYFVHVGNVLYVQVNQVADKPEEKLAQFSQRLHDEIFTTKPEKVAIDLRLNRGGDGTLISPLIRSFIQCEEIDRKGRLFAIIGPATFSAAQMLADALEKYTNVTFVGEPTGSKGNAYGDSRTITLPNSHITVRAAIYYWQDWHPLDTRDAIAPQIPAALTAADYANNVDPALGAIKSR